MAADGQPIGSHDARRLLKAVVRHRPFACPSKEAERAAWEKIRDKLSSDNAGPTGDVEERFWYLLDVYDRHRVHGLALAGLSKVVLELLETIVLCVKTYGYTRRNARKLAWGNNNVNDVADATNESDGTDDTEKEIVVTSEQPSQDASMEQAMTKAFSGLSEMKLLLTQSQRECTDKARKLAGVVKTNAQLQHENEQLREQVVSLQAELSETLRNVSKIKIEHHSRDDEAATRTQRIRDTMRSLVAMLDAGESY